MEIAAHSLYVPMRSFFKADLLCCTFPTAEAAGYLSGASSRLFLAVIPAAMRPCSGWCGVLQASGAQLGSKAVLPRCGVLPRLCGLIVVISVGEAGEVGAGGRLVGTQSELRQ